MKKVILTAVLVSALSFANHAQTPSPSKSGHERTEHKQLSPDERSAKDADWAEKKLGLNADQKNQWKAASLQRINDNAPIREKLNGSTTPEERKQLQMQMKENAKKFDDKVAALLTPEQKTKYDAAKEERRHKRMKHEGGMPPSGK